MTDTLRFTLLGVGSSPGAPRPNGDWGACDPSEPKNRRMRAAALVERIRPDGERTTVVIDTGPDFRSQMLMAGVKRIDAVVYTHSHADHIHGVDDLRTYVLDQRQRIPIHADSYTMQRLTDGFGYCFETPRGSNYPPILEANLIDHDKQVVINGRGGGNKPPALAAGSRRHHFSRLPCWLDRLLSRYQWFPGRHAAVARPP